MPSATTRATIATNQIEPVNFGQAGMRRLTFDMSGGPKGAKRPLERPLDGGVGRLAPALTSKRHLLLNCNNNELHLCRGLILKDGFSRLLKQAKVAGLAVPGRVRLIGHLLNHAAVGETDEKDV